MNSSKDIPINRQTFRVHTDEYCKVDHPEYVNLHILDQLGFHERIISLLTTLSTLYYQKVNLRMNDVSHGGFIPIQCARSFKEVYINKNPLHEDHINHNIITHCTDKNISYHTHAADKSDLYEINFEDPDSTIIISLHPTHLHKYHKYQLSTLSTPWTPHPTLYLYISPKLHSRFLHRFQYDLKDGILDYDNLIHLCIMVKNGGPQFEEMLVSNMPIIDRWTILDTGSTDKTIEIIHNTLIGTKRGTLHQEPFIDFKQSRNRCLDLAGTDCKFIIMLDDTYQVYGNLREFLNIVRGDQMTTSFTIMIHSSDIHYGSNRIIKSESGLRYVHRIHEVITDKDNINVVIPTHASHIIDKRFDYMEERTMSRKELDLKLLYEELEENKTNPRTYYYLAQTYNILKQYDKAYEFFLKRAEFSNSGFIQERIDALFEAARIANFQLNRPWDECLALYEKAYHMDESRPESIYFIAVHYYLEGNTKMAFEYFKKGFQIGFPIHCQYSLKPTLSYHFLPLFLTRLCYDFKDFTLGEAVSEFFLRNNTPTADHYDEIKIYYMVFKKLNEYKGTKRLLPSPYSKPIFVFVADGGFHSWTGSDILTSGVGGSETYIIEMARYIQKQGVFQVVVFCNCDQPETFEEVEYKHLTVFPTFINETYVEHCMISRFTEYLPLAYRGYTENVYLVLHDLGPSNNMIPNDLKLKKIFCLSEWHVSYFLKQFSQFKEITVPFHYGIDFSNFQTATVQKKPYQFIYSSFPNRGLLPLLQMWPSIYEMNPEASLHIYSDVHGKWVNDVAPDHMVEIRRLLEMNKEMNIHYHGWVDKKTLAQAWLASDIWFYPCIFMETFCLTALEAALTKTLVVSNDLAALQNTVGDRGVIIPGDPMAKEWQDAALDQLRLYFLSQVSQVALYDTYRERNYEWASAMSWENRATKLIDEHIVTNRFKYKGMYGWCNDALTGSKDTFMSVLQEFNTVYAQKKESVKVLEIGSYTGMSLIHILQQIPNAIGYGVDLWSSYHENNIINTAGIDVLSNMEQLEVEKSFFENRAAAGLEERMNGIKGDSHQVLTTMVCDHEQFDFIYIDGSHSSIDCYTDCYLAWKLLNKGGIMAIDDYIYNCQDDSIPLLKIKGGQYLEHTPFHGVNQFLKKHEGEYRVIDIGYRVFLEKL
jgi:glycosyltransferase involved in cell wall biosynthesis/predicted O-methyltransferase YrrM/tetratricopeptide (TPR) repeat protein